MNNETRVSPNALAAALGSAAVEVVDAAGAPLRVTVRLLKVREYPKFFELIDNELELVAFATEGATREVLDSLPANSLLDLVDKVLDLNFTTAQRWAERRANLGAVAVSFQERVKVSPSSSAASSARPPSS